MDQQLFLQSESLSNDKILLFYVDEDGGNQQGVLTTVENIEQIHGEQFNENKHAISDMVASESYNGNGIQIEDVNHSKDSWTNEEIRRLLVFYIDNKETFVTGATRRKHLWTVACNTMLLGKNMNACEMKLRNIKKKYIQVYIDRVNGILVNWPLFDTCHQAFHDDKQINTAIQKSLERPISVKVTVDNQVIATETSNIKTEKPSASEMVENMLKLYLNHKKSNIDGKNIKAYWQKSIWETIAQELQVENGDYWHKRFLNYKQQYIRMLEKRRESGEHSINWSYMNLFDQIFENDMDFQRKYGENVDPRSAIVNVLVNKIPQDEPVFAWNDTDITVLTKYYFDSYHEFEDPTIPNSFLWNEVGRLLDYTPNACKAKYEELYDAHIQYYIDGDYSIRHRKPMAILLDNIICKDVEKEMSKEVHKSDDFPSDKVNQLVQFFYDNIEMFKDPVSYYVCFASVSKKLKKSIPQCKKLWDDLKTVYRSVLQSKKDDSDAQVEWKYVELMDRIFDYGMDDKLLLGYENLKAAEKSETTKIGVKKLNINLVEDKSHNGDEESYDERGFMKRSKKHSGDEKAFQILEYYQKNKDKFNSQKKQTLWQILGKKIGLTPTQCAHRFRNLKQVYTSYVQREVNKPEMPILWPYYSLCKKVFGYRNIKSKLKNRKDSEEEEDWSTKEIKQLINFFAMNFNEISNNSDDSKWTLLASDIGKTETACDEKFVELRKCYRKLKTMKSRRSDVKVSWKYFNMFDSIFKCNENATGPTIDSIVKKMDIESNEEELKNDDDFHCIIVIPEGQDLTDLTDAQVITKEELTNNVQKAPQENMDDSNDTQNITTKGQNLTDLSDVHIKSTDREIINNEQSILQEDMLINSNDIQNMISEVTASMDITNSHMNTKELEIIDEQNIAQEDMIMNSEIANSNDIQNIMYESQYLNNTQHISQDGMVINPNNIQDILSEGQDLTDLTNVQINTKEGLVIMNNVQNIPLEYMLDDSNITNTKLRINKWTKRTKKNLLVHYLNYIRNNKGKKIDRTEMWKIIAAKLPNKQPASCRKMFVKLKKYHIKMRDNRDDDKFNNPYYSLVEKVLVSKPNFKKLEGRSSLEINYRDIPLSIEKVEAALQYYLHNIEEFVSPKIDNKYLWNELAHSLCEPVTKLYHKVNYLKKAHTEDPSVQNASYNDLLNEIISKEIELKSAEVKDISSEFVYQFAGHPWSDDETEILLNWYLTNLDKFKNPKFIRSYLWIEASNLMMRSPVECSQRMTEIRTLYKTMVKENIEDLVDWRFHGLCQKIYGTGKKVSSGIS